jgi:EAL domain-containing protein (putative c-di-GMP-specific phosphodiesterase class I)
VNADLRRLHVLVLDDDPVARARTIAACRQLGMQVEHVVDTAAAALDLLEALPRMPDLAMVEPHLADMDAADFIQSLAMVAPDVRLVVCSRLDPRLADAACSLARALGLHVIGALVRPLQAEDLARVLAAPDGPRAAASQHAALPLAADAAELLRALRRHEFELHYQPKFALGDMRPCGAEALLRWRHPDHGLLLPGRFLPQVRAARLLDPLTLEVLVLALEDWRGWNARGAALPLSLNLSPGLLTDPHLAARLIDIVEDAGVPAGALTFEITEDVELVDAAAALRVLIKLRLSGFGLSLDDYGTGFSSMERLACIPFTEIKIDRTLVHGAWARPHLQTLLRSAIGMAGALGIDAVAEGVEEAADLDVLRRLGCHQAQGFHLARPMPAADLARFAGGGAV